MSFAGGSEARADVVLVLPPTGSSDTTAEGARAVARIEERLLDEGFVVRPADEAERDRALASMTCEQTACVNAGLDALRVDFVLAPALWVRSDGTRELAIEAVGRALEPFAATEAAAAEPDSATEAGERMAERLLAWMPEARSEAIDVRAAEGDVSTTEPRRVSGWNYPVGASAIAAGVVPLAFAFAAFARDGECVNPVASGGCRAVVGDAEVYRFGTSSRVLLGVGAVAMVGGVVMLAARPIRVRASASPSSATIDVAWCFEGIERGSR